MKVAEFLSDLTSLQVCDPNAALALVSAKPESSTPNGTTKDDYEDNPELKRAKDLVELHSDVKLPHQDGTDKELNQAREAVAKVLRAL